MNSRMLVLILEYPECSRILEVLMQKNGHEGVGSTFGVLVICSLSSSLGSAKALR